MQAQNSQNRGPEPCPNLGPKLPKLGGKVIRANFANLGPFEQNLGILDVWIVSKLKITKSNLGRSPCNGQKNLSSRGSFGYPDFGRKWLKQGPRALSQSNSKLAQIEARSHFGNFLIFCKFRLILAVQAKLRNISRLGRFEAKNHQIQFGIKPLLQVEKLDARGGFGENSFVKNAFWAVQAGMTEIPFRG